MMAGRRKAAVLLAATVAVSTAGCSTSGLASLPLPHPGTGKGGYTINAVFANALNLPAYAKVRLAGADVGQLKDIVARDYAKWAAKARLAGKNVGRADCPKCGGKLTAVAVRRCPHCRKYLPTARSAAGNDAAQTVCPHCGGDLTSPKPRREQP